MGISGLLPLLKAITRNVHISQYANQRVAVDAYCWLHRGAYSCSTELCQNIPTVKYINFCLSRVQLLRSFNITPVLVFDGGALPSKRGQEEKRRKKRREERAKAAEYLQQGNRAAANDCFRKAVDITPRMAHKLIKALQQHGVECIVAPYEADAQLAYLSQTGYVHSVISEDSDLLPFGCKRVLFKMDGDGNGKEVQLSDLGQNTPTRFHNFTHAMFRQMCILSGCDYLASITGLGMKKAHGLLSKYRTMDRVFRFLKNDRMFVVPSDYEDAFERAERTFLHQSVFDHVNKRVIPLNPYPDGTDASSFPFCGELIPDDIACLIASGCVDPYSYEPFEEEAVQAPRHHHSAPTPTIVVPPHHHESDSGPSVGASYDQSQDALRASRSMRALSSSTGSCPPDRKLGRMPSFGGGRSKLPLLLPQRNSISSYFTPSSRHTLRPFVPPRGSSQSSQSSLEESERETPVDDDVVIEVKSEEEEEEEEEAGEEAEEDEKEKEQQREQEPARREGSRERQNREEQKEGTVYRSERMLEEERGDGWEVVKQRSYEVLVARTPSPHSRFKVAPRPLMGPEEEERSPSRRRLLFEDQVQVVVTSKYFSATTTTTTTATATATTTSRCSIPTTAPQSSTTAATPTPTVQATVSPTRTPTSRVASSAFAWLDGPLLLDPTAQSVEESDEEEEEARSREAKETKEKPTGEALRRSLRVTSPDKERQHAPERPPSRKRRREGEEELEEGNETRDVPVKRERKSALMSKVEAFLRSDSLEEAPRGDDGGNEEEKEGEGKRSEEPWKPTTEPTPAETIDLTFDELPDFESPMISRGKRLSTPLGFLSRSRNKQQQQQTQLPSTTPAKNGNGVGTLYSYFNKQGFNRQSPEASSSRSPSSQSPPSALPSLGEQPKLEEDGIEIVGFTPRTPAATDNTTAPRTRRTGFTSPYFS